MGPPDPVAQSYDRLAPVYDQRWRSYEEATLQAVLDAMPCGKDDRVLDVACGTGELERLLLARRPTLRMIGTDLSAGMLARAARKEIGGQVYWVRAEASRLPLPDQSFDWVVCANSFHYFRRPGAALQELWRMLRPGGRLVLVDWCDDYLSCKLCSWWLRWTDSAFHQVYGMRQCQRLLQGAGFQVVEQAQFRVGWLWGLMRFVCVPVKK